MMTSFEKALTRGVEVQVRSFFVPEHSDTSASHYFFSYHIRIRNDGDRPVRLLSRHWIITDGNGRVEEVKGPGVVGQQPLIPPGEEFEYESFCPLPTPTGMMRGSYQFLFSGRGGPNESSVGSVRIDDERELVDIEIPQFFLVEPNSFH